MNKLDVQQLRDLYLNKTVHVVIKDQWSPVDADGVVKYVDDAGQLHGTWSGLAAIPGVDVIELVGSESVNVYQVIFQDEYNNLSELCWVKSLADAVPVINEQLKVYGSSHTISSDDLKVYPSTMSMCFDLDFVDLFDDEDDSLYGCMIRGFIHEFPKDVADKLVEIKNG